MKKLIITLITCVFTGSLALADGPMEGVYGTTGVTSEYLLYEYPKVESDVAIGGLRLTVDQAKWSVTTGGGARLGNIDGDGVDVRVSQASVSDAPQSRSAGVLAEYPVSSHGVHGLKIVYGTRGNILFRHITGLRYYFTNSAGQTICFDVRPNAPHPDWASVNDLMLNEIRYLRS